MGSFEKKTGRTAYSLILEQELKELIDPDTGYLSLKYSRRIKCPLCGSTYKNQIVLFEKRGYTFVRCNSCGLIFANPQIFPEVIANGFNNQTFNIWAGILNNKIQMELDINKYQDILALIESHTKIGSLLDIGYTGGIFISISGKRGWNTTGLEHIKDSYNNARKINSSNVFYQRIDEPFPPFPPFDCITLFEFLEHIPNPKQYLKTINSYLKKSGLLFLLLPNVESLAAKILHEKTAMFDGRYQIIYYSIDTIKKLLSLSGFEIIYFDTIYASINPILQYFNYNDPYSALNDSMSDPLKKIGLNRNDLEKWILNNNLGYKIRVLAQKIS